MEFNYACEVDPAGVSEDFWTHLRREQREWEESQIRDHERQIRELNAQVARGRRIPENRIRVVAEERFETAQAERRGELEDPGLNGFVARTYRLIHQEQLVFNR